jgi:glycosyltransferase involved in cell wall biosynthesis
MALRPTRDLAHRVLLGVARRLTAAAARLRGGSGGGTGNGEAAGAAGSLAALGSLGSPGNAGAAAPDAAAIRSAFGFPACPRAEAPEAAASMHAVRAPLSGAAPTPASFAIRAGACVVSVCTRNYLYCARTALAAFRRHHPGMPAFLAIVDWDGAEPLAIEGTTLLACRSREPGRESALGMDRDLAGDPGDRYGEMCGDRSRDLGRDAAREIVGGAFDYMTLKYSALDLCGAVKPYVLDYVLRRTRFARIVFIDADVHTFAPFEKLLDRADHHDFVVTPHTLAPPPHPERTWERPTLGDLAFAGPLNSGLFALRATPEAQAFLHTWRDLVTSPGAFMLELGGQSEQNAFNWVHSFVDRVHVLRDPAYNVAYWNLHDRSLRFAGLDDPARDAEWTVDGRPLVAFHFSGYSLANPHTLSRHDHHRSLYIHPSLARLTELYGAELRANGAAEDMRRPYGFAALPSGIAVDERMRRIWKEHETFLAAAISPWTAAGEAHYCAALLSPIPYTGSLLPALIDAIYRERPDVQRRYPDARLQPDPLMRWISLHGIYEHGYQEIYDRHRSALPSRHGVVALAKARRRHPRIFAGLASPLGADRHRLLARLEAAGRDDLAALAAAVREGAMEHYYLSPIALLRRLVEERADVRRGFPDPLFADAAAFARWLTTHAAPDHCLPPTAAAVFLAKAQGRALARIFSFMNRSRPLMERWPLGLVGEGRAELAAALLSALRHGAEYDADDVLMYLWVMDRQPWAGLSLTFELVVNACRTPSPLLDEGQEALLGSLLDRRDSNPGRASHDGAEFNDGHDSLDRRDPYDHRDSDNRRDSLKRRLFNKHRVSDDRHDSGARLAPHLGFRAALARYRRDYRTALDRRHEEQIRLAQRPRAVRNTVFDALEIAALESRPLAAGSAGSAGSARSAANTSSAGSTRSAANTRSAGSTAGATGTGTAGSLRGPLPACHGVNLFGYHKSPIGLGSLSRGLALALGGAGTRVQPIVLGDSAMDADLSMADFVRTYDYRLDTNLFVSYPHRHDMLLSTVPDHVARSRRNIAYLAWEQRDGSHWWPEVYRDLDQVWALSDFAAESLRRFLRRDVETVPCVLDHAALPAPGAKRDFGLEPGKLTFSFIFDANSSIERKNPEAVIQAFARAFPGQDDVCLLLRIASGHRLHHRERLKRLLATAPRGLDLRLMVEPLAHDDLLRLLSATDCYVSLHRAEGFGYTCAEAMAYGMPVIATGYSGNLQFMNRDNSFLVDYREATVAVADGPYPRGSLWAEPDVDHAALLMRTVYDHPDLARATGARAQASVRRTLAPRAIGDLALAALGWPAAGAASQEDPSTRLTRPATTAAVGGAASREGALRASLEMK